jgi:hypothetical protein
MKSTVEMASSGTTYNIRRLMTISLGNEVHIKVTASTIREAAVLLMVGIYVARHSGGFR